MYMEQLERQQDEKRLISKYVGKSPKCNNLVFETLGLVGVFIYQLPDDQIKPFVDWLMYQTTTIIHGQPFAHATDYDSWYDAWIKGQTAIVID